MPARCGGPWARLGAWAPSLVCGGFARRSFFSRGNERRKRANEVEDKRRGEPVLAQARLIFLNGPKAVSGERTLRKVSRCKLLMGSSKSWWRPGGGFPGING